MTLHSMTGFGSAQVELPEGWRIRVEIKSVNHKALDVRINLPSSLNALEPAMLGVVRKRLHRGRVSIYVHAEELPREGAPLEIDDQAFREVCAQLRRLTELGGLSGDVTLADVMQYRRLFEKRQDQQTAIEDTGAVLTCLSSALDAFEATRRTEGATIADTFRTLLASYAEHLAAVETMRPQLLQDYYERMRTRVAEIIDDTTVSLDDQRLTIELAHMADRSDIAEELQRAKAHIDRIGALITDESDPDPVGKKLDFYLQEMIRETNTMGSKSNFADLTHHVVQMKSIVEQMREQSANTE